MPARVLLARFNLNQFIHQHQDVKRVGTANSSVTAGIYQFSRPGDATPARPGSAAWPPRLNSCVSAAI